jgi:hypothetical protein
MTTSVQAKYVGGTPGDETETYVLFNSATAFEAASRISGMGLQRFRLQLQCSDDGELRWYHSSDGGTTWHQGQPDSTHTVTGVADTSQTFDFFVGSFRDWKLEWINGGSAQDPWEVDMVLDDDPSPNE